MNILSVYAYNAYLLVEINLAWMFMEIICKWRNWALSFQYKSEYSSIYLLFHCLKLLQMQLNHYGTK